MEKCDSPVFQRSEVHVEHENMKNVTHLRERKRRRAVWREFQHNTGINSDPIQVLNSSAF